MTCVVGWLQDGEVWIGADSAGTNDQWELIVGSDPKVFRRGDFLIGFTSSFRMGQLLCYRLEPPERPAGMEPHEYMATLFVDAVRECLKAGGFARKDSEVESGGAFLVGYAGRLFCVEADYQVSQSAAPFAAVGCGAQVARGALEVLKTATLTPEEKLREALRAAEQWCAAVRGPFIIGRIRE